MTDFSGIYKEDKLIKDDFFSYIVMSVVKTEVSENKGSWLVFRVYGSGAHINNFANYLTSVFLSFGKKDNIIVLDINDLFADFYMHPRTFSKRAITYAALNCGLIFEEPFTRAMNYAHDYLNVRTDLDREVFFSNLVNNFLNYLLKRENISAICHKVESRNEKLKVTLYVQDGTNVVKEVVNLNVTGLFRDISDVVNEVARKLLCVKYTRLSDFNAKVKKHTENFLEIIFPTKPLKKVVANE